MPPSKITGVNRAGIATKVARRNFPRMKGSPMGYLRLLEM
jgi:hypothetical protein